MNTITFLRFVHILSMAIWFGGGLTLAGDVRKSLARGKAAAELLPSRVERTLTIGLVGAIGTIVSGLVLIFQMGGFKGISPRIHAGLGLALVAFAVELIVLRGAAQALGPAIAKDDEAAMRSLPKRFAMAAGIGHTLKLIILVLMVFRF
ncbi:MAG: hypothetical protein U0271_17735 [Polyangiaceae bacterium]